MMEKCFRYGIIDGYYGPLWSEASLEDYASFCQEYGHSFFIYAPKEEALLREKWFELFSEEKLQFLHRVGQYFKRQGIAFGIGLSPYGLNKLDEIDRQRLRHKITQLNTLELDILGVFFDDLTQQDISDNVGCYQVDIAHYIVEISNANRYITVPTYYSHDAILQRVLGAMPSKYFEQFSQIDMSIDIFWTGAHIVSEAYAYEDIRQIADVFGRKPFIWDNYPVNDMSYRKDFLRIMGLTGRPYQVLVHEAKGIAFNPMIQPYMSMIAMSTAYQLFSGKKYDARQAYLDNMRRLCGDALAQAIDNNLNYFILNGLKNTEMSNLKRMKSIFSEFSDINEKKFTNEILALINVYLSA